MLLRLLLLVVCSLSLIAPAASHAAVARPNDGVLRLSVGKFTPIASVDSSIAFNNAAFAINEMLFLPLYQALGSGALKPVLASGQPVVSRNGLLVTVRLRANAFWSDGHPVVAKDLVATFMRQRTSSSGYYFRSITSDVSRVTAVGTHRVQFHLKRPMPRLVPMFATYLMRPVPSHEITRLGKYWASGPVVGNGPFMLQSRGKNVVHLVRNPRYAGSVKLRGVDVLSLTPTATLAELKAGRIDAALPWVMSPAQTASAAQAGLTTATSTNPSIQFAYFNTRNSRLADPRVRRALALAVDRAGIARDAYFPGVSTPSFVPSMFPAFESFGHGPHALSGDGSPQVDAARALLAASGWAPGTRLNLVVDGEGPYNDAAIRGITDSLATIGVDVDVTRLSDKQFYQPGFVFSPIKSSVDILLSTWLGDVPDAGIFYGVFTCAAIKAGDNSANYCNAAYDAEYAKVKSNTPLSARIGVYRRLEQLLAGPDGSFPAVPISSSRPVSVARPGVVGFRSDPFGNLHLERVRIVHR